jgi:hypothetical protein
MNFLKIIWNRREYILNKYEYKNKIKFIPYFNGQYTLYDIFITKVLIDIDDIVLIQINNVE